MANSETRFESIFNHVNEGILIANGKGEIIVTNPRCRQMFGYQEFELRGHTVEKLIPSSLGERHIEHRTAFMKHPTKRPMGKNLVLHGMKSDGSQFPVEISLSFYESSEGMYVIAFIIDITESYEQREKIKKVNEELKQLNETLEKKVNERTLVLKEALHDLEKSRDELTQALEKEKELNEMKSRFISMASHEFRTPLSTVLSSVSLIGKYTETDEQEKRDKHIQRIKNSVVGLREILNDFLSLGKLEEGKMSAQLQLVDATSIIEDIIAELHGITKEGQKIERTFLSQTHLLVDPQLFRNVVINLLANAIKFSPENSIVTIHCKEENNRWEMCISDHGLGIPKEDQKHLFERFFRGKNVSNIQGTGLGLNIVEKYLELMHGTIRFESELEKGTKFFVDFPIPTKEN